MADTNDTTIEYVDVAALLDRWGWSEKAPPKPGRVADRLHDLVQALRSAKGPEALSAAIDKLDDLRASLDAFSNLPIVELAKKGSPDA